MNVALEFPHSPRGLVGKHDIERWLDQLARSLDSKGISTEDWPEIATRLLDEDLRVAMQRRLCITSEKTKWKWKDFGEGLIQEADGSQKEPPQFLHRHPALTVVAGASLITAGCALTFPALVGIAGLTAAASSGAAFCAVQSLVGVTTLAGGTALVKTGVDELELET